MFSQRRTLSDKPNDGLSVIARWLPNTGWQCIWKKLALKVAPPERLLKGFWTKCWCCVVVCCCGKTASYRKSCLSETSIRKFSGLSLRKLNGLCVNTMRALYGLHVRTVYGQFKNSSEHYGLSVRKHNGLSIKAEKVLLFKNKFCAVIVWTWDLKL